MYHKGGSIRALDLEIKEIDKDIATVRVFLKTQLSIVEFITHANKYHQLINKKNLLKDKKNRLV